MLGSVASMSVVEFGNILNDADVRSTYQIVDVREPHELEIASIKGPAAPTWVPKGYSIRSILQDILGNSPHPIHVPLAILPP